MSHNHLIFLILGDHAKVRRTKILPKNKIQIQEIDSDNHLEFEQAMNYTLKKNKELYKRFS